MAIPAYLFLKDDVGADIRGPVDVAEREGSIEINDARHQRSIEREYNHLEYVEVRYEKITSKHCDGNLIFSDSWNKRT